MSASEDESRFGASADIRFEQPIEAFAEFLTNHGLNHIELRQGYLDLNSTPTADGFRSLAQDHGITFTLHAPHIDCALGNVNEQLRRAAVSGVKRSLDMAAAMDAGGVVVHGGSARLRYPDRVNHHERAQAVTSLRECVRYAGEVGVLLCLENQRETAAKRRNTATPDRLAAFIEDLNVDTEPLRLTLDVGHAKASGVDYEAFVERFGDIIHIAHLHDNDGTADDHDPLPSFRSIAGDIGATYNVLEMKSLKDIERCVRQGGTEPVR